MYTRILKKLGRKLQTLLVVLAIVGLNIGTASAVIAIPPSGPPGGGGLPPGGPPIGTVVTRTSTTPEAYFPSIQAAIADGGTSTGDTLRLDDNIPTTSQVNVNKEVKLNGNGKTVTPTFAKTTNSNNSVFGVSANNVQIYNMAIDGASGTNLHGINAYLVDNLYINNVSINSNDRYAVVVNGSSVTVNNASTSGNGWGSMNVDQGGGVTNPAVLTITGTSSHTELNQIYLDDITKNVTFNDSSSQYIFIDPPGTPANDRMYYLGTVDTTAPQMSNLKMFVKDSSGNYNPASFVRRGDMVRIEVDATDANSGMKDVEFRIQALAGDYVTSRDWISAPFNGDTYRFEFQVPTDGKYVNTHALMNEDPSGHTVWARATDNAGNYNNGVSMNFTYDNTAPQMSNLKMFVKDGSGIYVPSAFVKNNDMVRIEVDSTDTSSGMKDVEFRIQNVSGGDYVTARDWISAPVTGNTYEFDFQVPADGKYINTHAPMTEDVGGHSTWVRATDNVGNYNNGITQLFTYDNTTPSVPVLTWPIGGELTNDNTPLMQWDDSTDDNGIAGYFYRVYFNCTDEGDVPNSCSNLYPNTTGVWRSASEYQAGPTNDGTYFWQVMSQDTAGNQSDWSGLEKVVIDTVPPAQPADLRFTSVDGSQTFQCGVFLQRQPVVPIWNASSDSDFDYYEYTSFWPDGSTGLVRKVLTNPTLPNNWMPPTEGAYGYSVRTVDSAGNMSEWSLTSETLAGSCQVIYDDTAPDVTIDSIELIVSSGTYYTTDWKVNDNTPTLVGTVSDDIEVASVSVNVNGNDYTATVTGNDWKVDVTDVLPDGTHTITATATDTAGNTTSTTQDVFIDTVAPSAVYTQYKNGVEITEEIAYVQSVTELSFSGEVTDPDPSAGLLYDSFVIFQAQDDGSFAFANNGKLSYCSWRSAPNLVNYDGTNAFTITPPVDFSLCTNTLEDGEYYMTHQVYDEAVRRDIPSIYQFRDVLGLHFIVDNTAPEIAITSVSEDPISGEVTIEGTASDNFGLMPLRISFRQINDDGSVTNPVLTVNPDSFDEAGTGIWSLTLDTSTYPQLTDGNYRIVARANDLTGTGYPGSKTSADTEDVTIDNTAPNITLDLPTDGAVLSGEIDLEATCDEECDYVNFWWRADGEGYSNSSPERNYHYVRDNGTSFTWTLDSLNAERWAPDDPYLMTDGTYYFKAAGKDVAGNWARTTETMIIIDNTAPEQVLGMTIYKGNDTSGDNLGCSGFTNNRWITVDWNDNADPNFDFYRYMTKSGWDTTLVPSERPGQISDLDGEYKYQVQAVDKAGNTGEYSDWCFVTLDREAPDVDLTAPIGGNTVSGTVNIEGTVTDLNNHHYWLVVQNSSNTTVAGPSVVNDTDANISVLLAWDTTATPDGEYTVKLEARDAADNKDGGSVEWATVTVDNTAPVSSELTSPVDTSFWGTPITITGETADLNGVDFVNIYYRTAGTSDPYVIASVSPIDNPADDSPFAWTTDWTPPTEGIYDIKAAGVDMAGNEESSVYALNVTYDVTVPTTVNAGPDRGNQSAPFAQTGTASDSNSGIYMTVWSQTSGPGEVLATGEDTLTPTFSATTDGIYVVRLTATDNAGNSDFDEFTFTWVTPPPDDEGGGTVNPGTPLPPTGEVEGATDNASGSNGIVAGDSDNAITQGDSENDGCFDILGLCWYWWVVIVAGTGLVYYLYRVFREEEEDEKK